MAISAADWSSATDPFILATDHSYTSTTGDLTNNRIIVSGSVGFLSGITDEKDVQEIYWSKDADKELTWAVNAFEGAGIGPHSTPVELGRYQERAGSTFILMSPTDYFEDDSKIVYVYVTGKSSGAVLYSLFAYTAYVWQRKDPAQIIFSWAAHHINSAFTLKDFLNQTSFQDASDYYDENTIDLSLWREVGMSISAQAKKVMQHTGDFLAIRPADADGKLQLHIMPRLSGLTARTTEIDLDSKSIKDYLVRPTDRYTLDRMDISYGAALYWNSSAVRDDPADYNTTRPLDLPGKNRSVYSQKVGTENENRSFVSDRFYFATRDNLSNHLDIGWWKDDQDEIEIDFADWSHLNLEVGDVVLVSGGESGYSSSEFLVVEKSLDLDTILSSIRCIQIYGRAGKRPGYADRTNLVLSLTPNVLGDYFDGTSTFPKDVFISDDPRNLDRVVDLSGGHAHISEMPRGTPAAANLQVDPDKRERWPVLVNDGTMGADFPYVLNDSHGVFTSVAGNLTFYIVLNPDNVVGSRFIFQQFSPGLVFKLNTNVQYSYSGLTRGTKAAITGWQILTYILDTAGSTIRRNGADLETGLSYTAVQLVGPSTTQQSLLVATAGDLSHFSGEFGEIHGFAAAHNSTTVAAIEAHLAEKYNIPI